MKTTSISAQRIPRCSCYGFCKTAIVGTDPCCTPIYHLPSARGEDGKCWWFKYLCLQIPQKYIVLVKVVYLFQTLQSSLITAEQIRQYTSKDPILSRVRELVAKGWNGNSDEQLGTCRKPMTFLLQVSYQKKKRWAKFVGWVHTERKWSCCACNGENSSIGYTTWWSSRQCQNEGYNKTSSMVTWYWLCKQQCKTCQVNQKSPAVVPLDCWEWPKKLGKEYMWITLDLSVERPF